MLRRLGQALNRSNAGGACRRRGTNQWPTTACVKPERSDCHSLANVSCALAKCGQSGVGNVGHGRHDGLRPCNALCPSLRKPCSERPLNLAVAGEQQILLKLRSQVPWSNIASTCWPKRWKCLQTQSFQTVNLRQWASKPGSGDLFGARSDVQQEERPKIRSSPSSPHLAATRSPHRPLQVRMALHQLACPMSGSCRQKARIYHHPQPWRRCGAVRDLPALVAFAIAGELSRNSEYLPTPRTSPNRYPLRPAARQLLVLCSR